jgi:hypothetical protein
MAEMLGNRARARKREKTRARVSSLICHRADLGGEKGVKNEMLGSFTQRRENESRSEEKRVNERFFESSCKDLNPLWGTETCPCVKYPWTVR